MREILILVLALTILLTACQPTPEDSAVIAKDHAQQIIEEAGASETESGAQASTPEVITPDVSAPEYITADHVNSTFHVVDGMLDITIDADKQIPNVEAYPVAKIQASDFSQEQAEALMAYFMQGGELVSLYEPTKDDYDSMIVQAKRGHLENGEYIFDKSDQNNVDYLMEQRQNAPERDIREPITDRSINGEKPLRARIFADGTTLGTIYAKTKAFSYSSSYRYLEESSLAAMELYQGFTPQRPDVSISEQQAANSAAGLLADLGIEGFAPKAAGIVYLYQSNSIFGYQNEELQAAYLITFMRQFGGMMPELTKYSSINETDQYDYMPPFTMEYISIVIDEQGVIHQFAWSNPIKIVETMAENVTLLPFEDVLQCLEQYAKYHWAWMDGMDLYYTEYYIDNISLNLYCLPMKDNPNEYMYVPCWFFTYTMRTYYPEERYAKLRDIYGNEYVEGIIEKGYAEQTELQPIILNAIDGGSVCAYPATAVQSVIDSGV